jgi:hypothetical protein
LIAALSGPPADTEIAFTADFDPVGEDAQLALYVCYELHYRGFSGVQERWEWNPCLLAARARLEEPFEEIVRAHTPISGDVAGRIAALLSDDPDGPGLSPYLARAGNWEQMRELFIHRSLYHLKEADPHAWAIPRLEGRGKAALVSVEFDEYGGGRAERMHSALFVDLLAAAGLNADYLGYIDVVPAQSLAIVNFMSLCGLHRRLRGALAGLFAAAEITTAPSARRMVSALTRMGAPDACVHFYAEHIAADAVHEQVMRHDVLGGLLEQDPAIAADIVVGVDGAYWLESRLSEHVIGSWQRGETSLIRDLSPV